ncbi:MAG: hypothetical protein ABIR51_06055 [Sphingomicrobium sp.]
MTERDAFQDALTKVPAVTLGFWIIKILATTLGETAGDTVSMTWKPIYVPLWTQIFGSAPAISADNLGYIAGTLLFATLLAVLVIVQTRASKFHPFLYWGTIVASTTAGTTLADFADRSLGIGYPGGSLILLACVLASLFSWHRSLGSVNVETVAEPRAEAFYWITITFSQTLGTALGDWVADSGPGYSGGALIFGAALLVLVGLYYGSKINRVFLFWAAFILTRPLGATVGDYLDKPLDKGGLAFSRPVASAVLLVVIVALILLLPQRAGRHPGSAEAVA